MIVRAVSRRVAARRILQDAIDEDMGVVWCDDFAAQVLGAFKGRTWRIAADTVEAWASGFP